jgi:cytochrome o ubiquinol oxidase subunit 2
VITFLGGIAWFGSHALDPYKPLPPPTKPVEIEVVSLDWKWLFIYPKDGIAAVNQLIVPVAAPLHFRLTSSGAMNSFFVPQLGRQIYTMAGMTSQLNLQADKPGSYRGLSAQFSGEGFADMHFLVSVVPGDAYVSPEHQYDGSERDDGHAHTAMTAAWFYAAVGSGTPVLAATSAYELSGWRFT